MQYLLLMEYHPKWQETQICLLSYNLWKFGFEVFFIVNNHFSCTKPIPILHVQQLFILD